MSYAVVLHPSLHRYQVLSDYLWAQRSCRGLLLTFIMRAYQVLSDYLWARAVMLLGPTVATAGLSVQIPMAAVADVLLGYVNWTSSVQVWTCIRAFQVCLGAGVHGAGMHLTCQYYVQRRILDVFKLKGRGRDCTHAIREHTCVLVVMMLVAVVTFGGCRSGEACVHGVYARGWWCSCTLMSVCSGWY